jgi:cephalosporin hydroxylase
LNGKGPGGIELEAIALNDPSITSLPLHVLNDVQRGHLAYQYKGVPTLKSPFDLALYSMLLWNVKPRTIVEIGSYSGGSALWLADQIRCMNLSAEIHSFDLEVPPASDPLVHFRQADAESLINSFPPHEIGRLPRPLLVIEDASHQKTTSLAVLDYFAPLMKSGEYIVVEDGIVTGLGMADAFDGGPIAAIAEFLGRSPGWEIDRHYCDFFGRNVTWSVDGFLRKK